MLKATMSSQDLVELELLEEYKYDFVTLDRLKRAISDTAIRMGHDEVAMAAHKMSNRLWRKMPDAPWATNNPNGFRPRLGVSNTPKRIKALRNVEWPSEKANWGELIGEGV